MSDLAGLLTGEAAQIPGWESLAERIGVHADGGEVYAGLHPHDGDHQQAFDLEFGTDKVAPTGLLRNTAMTHGRDLSEKLTQAALSGVVGVPGGVG